MLALTFVCSTTMLPLSSLSLLRYRAIGIIEEKAIVTVGLIFYDSPALDLIHFVYFQFPPVDWLLY